jgi:hypothetical protein
MDVSKSNTREGILLMRYGNIRVKLRERVTSKRYRFFPFSNNILLRSIDIRGLVYNTLLSKIRLEK